MLRIAVPKKAKDLRLLPMAHPVLRRRLRTAPGCFGRPMWAERMSGLSLTGSDLDADTENARDLTVAWARYGSPVVQPRAAGTGAGAGGAAWTGAGGGGGGCWAHAASSSTGATTATALRSRRRPAVDLEMVSI